MIFVTGGAYQGKTAYVRKTYDCDITDGACCTFQEAKAAHCVDHYHVLIRRLSDSGIDAVRFTNNCAQKIPRAS